MSISIYHTDIVFELGLLFNACGCSYSSCVIFEWQLDMVSSNKLGLYGMFERTSTGCLLPNQTSNVIQYLKLLHDNNKHSGIQSDEYFTDTAFNCSLESMCLTYLLCGI